MAIGADRGILLQTDGADGYAQVHRGSDRRRGQGGGAF